MNASKMSNPVSVDGDFNLIIAMCPRSMPPCL